MELQQCWERIQERICHKCVDGDGSGNCRLPAGTECALYKFLPLVVNAVQRVQSDDILEYVKDLRSIVCAQCPHEQLGGKCRMRDELECALDRYFPLVIDTIEEVRAQYLV